MDDRALNILQRELSEWLASSPPTDGTQTAGSDIILTTAKNARSENQDRAIYVNFSSSRKDRSFSLLAVLDGIGGMVDGGRCADICVSTLITAMLRTSKLRNRLALIEALGFANREVWKRYNGRGGTTFAGVFFDRNGAKAVNIGDSHVYEHRQAGGLVQKSVDDRLGAQFAKLKGLENISLNPELAGRLAQYVGMQGQTQPHITAISNDLFQNKDNFLLLTTDGVRAQDFLGRQIAGKDCRAISKALIEHSALGEDADNATVICVRADVLRTKYEPAWYPFEHLRVWSVHGVFNFLFPNAEERMIVSIDPAREREHQKSQVPSKAEPTPQPDLSSPKITPKEPASETPEPNKKNDADAARPQVTIRQLTFEPVPDEPTD